MDAYGIDLTSKIIELNETLIMEWYKNHICDPKWTYCTPKESKLKWVLIGIGIAMGFILIILLIFGYYVILKKRKQEPGNQILILNNIIQNNESIVVNSHGGSRNSTRNSYDWEQHLDILPKFDEGHITKGKLIGT